MYYSINGYHNDININSHFYFVNVNKKQKCFFLYIDVLKQKLSQKVIIQEIQWEVIQIQESPMYAVLWKESVHEIFIRYKVYILLMV